MLKLKAVIALKFQKNKKKTGHLITKKDIILQFA